MEHQKHKYSQQNPYKINHIEMRYILDSLNVLCAPSTLRITYNFLGSKINDQFL